VLGLLRLFSRASDAECIRSEWKLSIGDVETRMDRKFNVQAARSISTSSFLRRKVKKKRLFGWPAFPVLTGS
jgi:hypothetical protein